MKILNLIAFLVMVIVNIWAVNFPFWGLSPGDISDLFPTMFTPADFTFTIWSLIYLALGFFIIKCLLEKNTGNKEIKVIGYLFGATCLYNIGWLLAWQSQNFEIAIIFMCLLWGTLAWIYYKLAINDAATLFTIPFSLYLGWIAVSIIANFNVFLIDARMAFMGMEQENWTIILLSIVILGGFLMLYWNKDIVFTTVLIWAFIGIVFKNMEEINNMVLVGITGIILLSLATILVGVQKQRLT